jgi:hypothetical protein
VSENRVLRRMFGPKRDEVAGEWRKLHNEELNDLYTSPNILRLKRTTDTFLVISHTTNVLLFKFRCDIFIGARIIKEMPVSVASGTPCIKWCR